MKRANKLLHKNSLKVDSSNPHAHNPPVLEQMCAVTKFVDNSVLSENAKMTSIHKSS